MLAHNQDAAGILALLIIFGFVALCLLLATAGHRISESERLPGDEGGD